MAEMNVIRDSFRTLQMEMRANALSRQIRDFSGDGGKRFKDWLSDIERVCQALDADVERYKALCFQTLKGSAGNFFARHIQANPNHNWQRIKQALTAQYAEDCDAHIAGQKLRRLTQKQGESVQSFAERIQTLAREAYQDINQPLIQTIMVDVLIDGTRDDTIARRLILERPNDLNAALTLAINEQTASKTFKMRRKNEEEPMDISTVQTDPKDARISKLEDNLGIVVAQMGHVLDKLHPQNTRQIFGGNRPSFDRSKQNFGGNRPTVSGNRPPHKWTSDGKPICSNCHKPGHVFRDCRGRQIFRRPLNKQNLGN